MKKTYRLLLALAPCFALPTAGLAQTSAVPPYISYQGTVAAADGTAVGGNNAPVNRSVVFRIWSHPTNSALTDLLYSETQVVTIVDGQFSVLIGEGVATTVGNYGEEGAPKKPDIATAFAGRDCYLGVTVAAGASLATSDNEISPRQRIVSTGFAFRAKVAENLIGTASLASGSDFTLNPSTLPTGSVASNYGLGWYGTGRSFGNTPATVDGPVLYGNSGGALGSSNGTGGNKNLALLWNNAGQVGIGTTGTFAAGNKLTLQGDDTTTPASQLSIRGNADANKRLLLGYNTTSNLGSLQAYSAATTTSDILLNPAGGNIGIGMTTAPTQKLQVNGNLGATGDVTIKGMVQMGSGTGTAEAPSSGIIIRKVQSMTKTAGSVIAKESFNGMSVVRDGSNGGLTLKISTNNNANAFVKVYNSAGTLLRSVNRAYRGAADYAICADAENVSRVEVTMADAINGGGFTELVLTRWVEAGSGSPNWTGMITTTTNQ